MTYTPKIGEDAKMRNGGKAVLIAYDLEHKKYPLTYYDCDDGLFFAVTSTGQLSLEGKPHKRDLIGPWVEPKEKEKTRLEWEKKGAGRTQTRDYHYVIQKINGKFQLLASGVNKYQVLSSNHPTKKAAKAAAQRDADSR